MCGSIWRAHIDWGDLLPRRPDTPDGPHQGGLYFSLSLSLFLFDSLCILAIHPSTSLSRVPFSHSLTVSIAPSPSSTPLTYLLKDIWLSLNCLSLSVCLSLLTRCIFPAVSKHLVCGLTVSHRMLQWQRYCRYCAAMLRNPGSIVNGSGESVMHVLCVEL